MDYCLVVVSGRLGKDPELVYTQNGTAKCKLSIATNRILKTDQNGNAQKRTIWHRAIVWGKQAEACAKYLSKGNVVGVQGEIDQYEFENDQHQMIKVNEIVVSRVMFGSNNERHDSDRQSESANMHENHRSQSRESNKNSSNSKPKQEEQQSEPDDDDIPF